MNIYTDDKLVEQLTKHLMAKGTTVFQIWKKGHTDAEHCRWLLDLAQFPRGAHVLDIGCGIGGVALRMQQWNPSLEFSLQNCSAAQLELCPRFFTQFQGDMDKLEEVPSGVFDAAMVCYALGHVHYLDKFLHNAARVLKPGGKLFVYDVQPLPGWEQWALDELGYRTWTLEQLVHEVWTEKVFGALEIVEEVQDAVLNCTEFLNACPLVNAADVCTRTKPVGYRFIKTK